MDFVVPIRSRRALPGVFSWSATPVLSSPRQADAVPLDQLVADLQRAAGLKARIAWTGSGEGNLAVRRDPAFPPEGYRLVIRKDGIEVRASRDAGVYYAIQTLRELVAAHGRRLPCCRIDDRPDFARRGVYFDVARGRVPSVATLQALIERLAHWKINEFHIYVKNTFTWRRHPAIGVGFSPYTPEDILAVQAHCRLHHVRFVPSLATLSHNELILQLPPYRRLAELPGSMGWEGGTMLCPTDPRSFRLVEELYAEYVPLFEATDMNVGCDEPWELGKGRSKRMAQRIGEGQVYLNFLLKLHRLCAKHGKRMNAWGDIVLKHPELIPRVPKDLVMLNWDYHIKGARLRRTCEFSAAGIPVMVCPGTSGWLRHGTDMPNAMANVALASRIGRCEKAEGLLNTDWGDYGHRNPLGVSFHGFAHGAAHAWNGRGVDESCFTETFAARFFGSAAFARPLRILGSAAATSGHPACLYHALVEPVLPPADRFLRQFRKVPVLAHYPQHFPNVIEHAKAVGLAEVINQLDVHGFWPDPPAGLPPFEQLALADCRLGTKMNVLAARHALMGQAARRGAPTRSCDWKAWADAMAELREQFAAHWRSRFRPSRLADNLRLMRLAENEARTLARKRDGMQENV